MNLNVTLAHIQALARLVWRYEFGVHPEARLIEQFEEAINQLQALMVEWRPLLSGLRHRPSTLMRDCDNALNLAVRLRKSSQYRECLGQLKLARNKLALLQELLEAYGEYGFASDSYQKLKALLDSEHLCRLLTIETIARLLEESDKLLSAGRSRQARFIACLCRNKALALFEVTDEEGERVQELSVKIKRQAEFFRETEAFAPSPFDDLKLRRALERLPDLLAQHRIMLVARLIEDIECELAPRRTVRMSFQCLNLYEKSVEATRKVADDLKRIIHQESWEKAATYLLQQVLTVLSSEVGTVQPAIGCVTQRMEAAHLENSHFQPEATSDLN